MTRRAVLVRAFMVEEKWKEVTTGEMEVLASFHSSSSTGDRDSARALLSLIRGHLGIELAVL